MAGLSILIKLYFHILSLKNVQKLRTAKSKIYFHKNLKKNTKQYIKKDRI